MRNTVPENIIIRTERRERRKRRSNGHDERVSLNFQH